MGIWRAAISGIVIASVCGWAWATHQPAPERALSPILDRASYDPNKLNRTIAFWEGRVYSDPEGALSRTQLAALYLQRSRSSGDSADIQRAQDRAMQSLHILRSNNPGASSILIQSLVSQHRFSEAKQIAVDATGKYGESGGFQRQLAEIEMELGNYDTAGKILARADLSDPSVLSAKAKLEEIYGHVAIAVDYMTKSKRIALRNRELDPEASAWFCNRLGDILRASNHLVEAEQNYADALTLFPRDYRAMFGIAKLHFREKRFSEAAKWCRMSAEIVPTPEVMSLLGDALEADGDHSGARSAWQVVEASAKISKVQGGLYDRQFALYCADHGVHLEEALRLATRELQIRHDIFACDTLAWVNYKAGKIGEAKRWMDRAMATGCKDPRITGHANEIAAIHD